RQQCRSCAGSSFTAPPRPAIRHTSPINESIMKKIDIYNHVLPPEYLELVRTHSKDAGIVKRMVSLRMLWDLEARAAMMVEKFPDVVQVLTLSQPSPEMLGGPERSPEFARVANDGMAEICRRWPGQFPAFVAALP